MLPSDGMDFISSPGGVYKSLKTRMDDILLFFGQEEGEVASLDCDGVIQYLEAAESVVAWCSPAVLRDFLIDAAGARPVAGRPLCIEWDVGHRGAAAALLMPLAAIFEPPGTGWCRVGTCVSVLRSFELPMECRANHELAGEQWQPWTACCNQPAGNQHHRAGCPAYAVGLVSCLPIWG